MTVVAVAFANLIKWSGVSYFKRLEDDHTGRTCERCLDQTVLICSSDWSWLS